MDCVGQSDPSMILCLTLEADGDAEVHDEADEGHDQAEQDEEDPVLPNARDQELLTVHCTDWRAHQALDYPRCTAWTKAGQILEA